MLDQTGVVRQDIRSNFAGLSGSATGVPIVIQLSLVSASQIALPKATSDMVHAQSGYSGSPSNPSRVSLASDMLFSDGSALELATVTGNTAPGPVAALTVAV